LTKNPEHRILVFQRQVQDHAVSLQQRRRIVDDYIRTGSLLGIHPAVQFPD
jgi:hypothetical protein